MPELTVLERLQQAADLEFEIEKRLGSRPLLKLDKMLTRMDEMSEEIRKLTETLYVVK